MPKIKRCITHPQNCLANRQSNFTMATSVPRVQCDHIPQMTIALLCLSLNTHCLASNLSPKNLAGGKVTSLQQSSLPLPRTSLPQCNVTGHALLIPHLPHMFHNEQWVQCAFGAILSLPEDNHVEHATKIPKFLVGHPVSKPDSTAFLLKPVVQTSLTHVFL